MNAYIIDVFDETGKRDQPPAPDSDRYPGERRRSRAKVHAALVRGACGKKTKCVFAKKIERR